MSSAASSSSKRASTTSTTTPRTSTTTTNVVDDVNQVLLQDESTKELLKYALMLIGAAVLIRFLLSTMAFLSIILFPLLYVYALQTCPSMESFEAKKELKRVLRGHHLPADHPNKPKGFLDQMAARVAASVTAEMATLPGYQQEMTSLAGAMILASLTIPSQKNLQLYWIGVNGQWYYLFSRQRPNDTDDAFKQD